MNAGKDSRLALVNGTLIDGIADAPIPDVTILINEKKIEKVGKSGEISYPTGTREFDAKGKFIIPGLMDAHVHFAACASNKQIIPRYWNFDQSPATKVLHAYRNAKNTLMAGFTTVRNAGNVTVHMPEDIVLRDAIYEGIVTGPRILACGGGISATGGHGSPSYPSYLSVIPGFGFAARTVDGADEIKKEVRRRVRMGADFIKIYTSGASSASEDIRWTFEEVKAATEEAHNCGKRVASHAMDLVGVKMAVKAGVDTIEHCCVLDDETIEMMLKAGTYISPTLQVVEVIGLGTGRLPQSYFNFSSDKIRAIIGTHLSSIGRAHEAGVKIIFATDTYNLLRHGSNASEFAYLVKAGLSAMEAIKSATKRAAEAFDIGNELGSIEGGKLADLLVIDGNPLENIRILEDLNRVEAVIKDGEVVKGKHISKTSFEA